MSDMPDKNPIRPDKTQKQFCEMPGGAIRLLAPAGAGKTFSLLHRCRALAEKSDKTKPRFMLFTFTRAASEELRDRLRSSPEFMHLAPLVTITTLNAWGFKQLKNSTRNARLFTSDKDRHICIHNVLQSVWMRHAKLEELLTDNRRKGRAGKALLQMIDHLKAMGFRHDRVALFDDFQLHWEHLLDCGLENQMKVLHKKLVDIEVCEEDEDPCTDMHQGFIPFWTEACDQLRNVSMFSLEDQKYWARLLLEDELQNENYTLGGARYHHILVDEFQDINPLDVALLKTIAALNKAELTLAGDDDQAIFEWRGATPEFILNPGVHLGGNYQTCILETNYRSPKNIVEHSQKLIAHNKRRVPKQVKAKRSAKAEIQIRRHYSISDAITDTTRLVNQLLASPDINSVALISRKRSQIIPYQIIFAGQGEPFYAAEDLHVFLSEAFREMKDILAMRGRASMGGMFANDPVQDVVKLCDKVKKYPLSKKDRESLQRHLYNSHPGTLWDAAMALYRYTGSIKGDNRGGKMSATFADAILCLLNSDTVAESIQAISDHFEGLQRDYGKSLEDVFYTDPPFFYLAEMAERYGEDYGRFYSDVERAIATLVRVPPDEDDQENDFADQLKSPLHLMTALRAKGKEFDAVIILDANDGIWPMKLAKTDQEKEQERRLFYVAMTRARKALYFVLSDHIVGVGFSPSPYLVESGFEIPQDYVEVDPE